MKHVRLVAAMMMGAALSACGTVDIASRNAPFETQPQVALSAPQVQIAQYNVRVPSHLRVSEANVYYPLGDIVWRGDPLGNRHEQIRAMFNTSISRVATPVEGARPVLVDIEVKRFHSVTEKTRYTVGGTHSIQFDMRLVDAQTGVQIGETREIDASFPAFGGARAIHAEQNGITQKYRVTNHLANVIRAELQKTES